MQPPTLPVLACLLAACAPKHFDPAWSGTEVLPRDAAPMGVTADRVLDRHAGLRVLPLGDWDALPADLSGLFGELETLSLDVRRHPRRAPSLMTDADRWLCPAPPCFLVPVRVEHRYDDALVGRGNGAISVPARDPDTWTLVPYPTGLSVRGPLKRQWKAAWEDLVWQTLTSQPDALPAREDPEKPTRTSLIANLTFPNGVRQAAIGCPLDAGP